MFCKNCGANLRDGAVFCPECGTKVTTIEEPKTTQPPQQEATTIKTDVPPQKNGTKKRIPFIILGIVIVALVGIIIALLLGGKDTSESTDVSSDVPVIQSDDSVEEQTTPPVTEEPQSEETETEETETTAKETDSQTALDMSQEELEAEVLRIREVWTTDRDAISNALFDVSEPQAGIKIYSSDNDIKMVEVKSDMLNDYNMTFQVENGKLTFAYYESATSQIRLYYKDEKLIRWIQTDIGTDPIIHDLEYSNETFLSNGQLALNDLSSILNAEPLSDVSSITMDSVLSIQASSYLSEKNYTHFPENIVDGTLQNAWVEGAVGQGVEEWIQFSFNGTYTVSGIEIYSGYQKSADLYQKNSRPKDVRIVFSDGTEESFTLDDIDGIQTLYFSKGMNTDTLTLYIESVYPGTKFEDTVISEINLF